MACTAGATWSKEETLNLIEIWGQETIRKQLQEYKEISQFLKKWKNKGEKQAMNEPFSSAGRKLS